MKVQIKVTYNQINDNDIYLISNLNHFKISNKYKLAKLDDFSYAINLFIEKDIKELIYNFVLKDKNKTSFNQKQEDNISDSIARAIVLKDNLIIQENILSFGGNVSKDIKGNLDIYENFYMKELNQYRTIRVYTPSNYDKNKRYPVIYLHDGQNLFDNTLSFSGAWNIDNSMEELIEKEKIEGYIMVGIDNSIYRIAEYTPSFIDLYHSVGFLYAKFIKETLKPFIDNTYSTKADRNNTLVAGSSMGGLISYYIGLLYSDTFGLALCFSTALQLTKKKGRMKFLKSIAQANHFPFLYIDAGGLEPIFNFVDTMKKELLSVGYPEEKIITKIYPYHAHNEAAWRIRFKEVLLNMHKKVLDSEV